LAVFEIENLSFTYPNREEAALSELSFSVEEGGFVLVCGQTGCGKSTLLRHLKTALTPVGNKEGKVFFYGRDLDLVGQREQSQRIGFVLQNPESQIVTDKVWHELAFGLESLGTHPRTIRLRVSEMASFFGIQHWFHRDVAKLSGGQKQLLNLAAVMAMQPDVLILDEPTSQLDPIAAADFLETVQRINREIGTTVLITEHRLEEILPAADQVLLLHRGRLLAADRPQAIGRFLAQTGHPMLFAMPTPLQVFGALDPEGSRGEPPLTVREGRMRLREMLSEQEGILEGRVAPAAVALYAEDEELGRERKKQKEAAISLKEVWFRYERDGEDVLRDLNVEIPAGEIYAIVGGNGSGKTTALRVMGGLQRPYRGKVVVKGSPSVKKREKESLKKGLGMLPQDPKTLFFASTLKEDLEEALEENGFSEEENRKALEEVVTLTGLEHLLSCHPSDLSGGEQQRGGLAKVLLTDPAILLLDEPTKGLDSFFKKELAEMLKKLKEQGKTIVLVSHDVEFCAQYADRCAMFFDGSIVGEGEPGRFFADNSFYTTAANRMSRQLLEGTVTAQSIIDSCREHLL